ncbi:retrovirus-related pol polyprotein LINE-1 [Tanacetum coccineum]
MGRILTLLFSMRWDGGTRAGGGPNRQPHPERYYSRINQAKVKTALQKMGRNKAIFTSAKMPEEWRLSEVIPIFKNKGDAQVCSNYRGIKLLGHTMKLWERVIERRLRRETSVSENQFGFMPGRSSVEAIHLIRSLMEKYRERQRDLHMAFLDLEKAYDNISRELIWKTLVDKGTSRRYIKAIRDMYNGAKTRVRTSIGNTKFFPVDVGLHQGSAISPYLFALILDELSREIQEDIPWCLIFADDIVLVSESAEGLNMRLEDWRKALEDNGLRVSREGEILQPKESFRYLGSILHKSGRIDEDVSNRIKAAWLKWRAATGVLCDRKVPLKLKGKFYRVAIRPAMLYGSECWPITKALANRVEVAELRMLRWTCGRTLLDMIPNGVYRALLEVETIINKMREGRLRWFGHVRRRPQSSPVRRVEALVVDGLRRRGRPKLRLDRWARIRLEGFMEGVEGLVSFGLPFVCLVLYGLCVLVSCLCFLLCLLPCSYACFVPFVLLLLPFVFLLLLLSFGGSLLCVLHVFAIYAEKLLKRAHIQSCNSCRTLVDIDSKLGSDGELVSDPTLSCISLYSSVIRYVQGTIEPAKRQTTLSRPSAEAEYRDVANVVAETTWVHNL